MKEGFRAACERLDLTCYIALYEWDGFCPDYKRLTTLDWIIDKKIHGIALTPCEPNDNEFIDEAKIVAPNVPFITFDSDAPETQRVAHVGTDEIFLGRTMARLLKQLRPEGGTFAFVGDKEPRDQAFTEEMMRDNGRMDRAQWYPSTPFKQYNGSCEELLDHYIDQTNTSAIVTMIQSPMRVENWTEYVTQSRSKGMTFIGVDSSDFQLDYLNQRYVDGLVGQSSWGIGKKLVEILYENITNGFLEQDFYPTNLIAHNVIPLELPPLNVDQNLLGPLKWIGVSLFIVVALCTLICIAWTAYHGSSSVVVAASQPFFLVMTAVGIIILATTLIPLSMDDGGDIDSLSKSHRIGMCMSIPWLAFTGFSIVFSALLAKTWRINQLVSQSVMFGRIKVSVKDVLGPFALTMFCNVLVLSIWTALDPLTYNRSWDEGTDFWNREFSSSGACECKNAAAYLVPLGLINFIVVCVAVWQAIKARNIKSEFSESKYIGLSVFSMAQAFLSGIPIVAVVRDSPQGMSKYLEVPANLQSIYQHFLSPKIDYSFSVF